MFQNTEITTQPIFYLFIAATILLSLGYAWGKRRNKRIYLSAFNGLTAFLKPKDQTYTTIGGLTGYHANIIPKRNKVIRRVDATITLLARQSWLYFPFSKLIRKFDRLYITMLYAKNIKSSLGEAHLIEEKFEKFSVKKIDDPEKYSKESIRWGGMTFSLYTTDSKLNTNFKEYVKNNSDPMGIRHLAIVPNDDKAFVFMVPRIGSVEKNFPPIFNWIEQILQT
jgi:hypothetical protein